MPIIQERSANRDATTGGRAGIMTENGTGTIALARQDLPLRAIAADRARNSVGAVPHNGTMHRDDTITTAGHPDLPRHPPCLLKSRFNRKKRGSAE